jgi:SlyX protein
VHEAGEPVPTTEQRLDELEARAAFAEDTAAKLSDALIEQQARLDRLDASLRLLSERLSDQAPYAAPDDAPPPHY